MPAFCLSLHAGYRCRHAGACCRNWTVPAEDHVIAIVGARGAAERVRVWRPGTRSLAEHVAEAFEAAQHERGADPAAQSRAMDRIVAIAPPDVRHDLVPIDRFEARWIDVVASAFASFDRAMKNYWPRASSAPGSRIRAVACGPSSNDCGPAPRSSGITR